MVHWLESFSLNESQRQALDLERHTVVLAGAGSGKTRVLVLKYLLFLDRWGVEGLERVLAITFTNKAAGEMKERIRHFVGQILKLVPPEEQRKWRAIRDELEKGYIMTIHSLAARLLREHALEVGLDPSFAVLDEEERDWQLHHLLEERLQGWEEGEFPPYVALLEHYHLGALRRSLHHLFHANGLPRSEELKGQWETSLLEELALNGLLWENLPLRAWMEWLEAILQQVSSSVALEEPLEVGESFFSLCQSLLHAYRQFLSRRIDLPTLWKRVEPLFLNAKGQFRTSFLSSIQFLEGEERQALNQVLSQLSEQWKKLQVYLQNWPEVLEWEPLSQELLGQFFLLYQDVQSHYERWKQTHNLLDFQDLEEKALFLLEREEERHLFDAILVDEFQDTNHLQWELVQKLCSPEGKITLVGDEKQAIYQWRGAELEVFQKARGELCSPQKGGVTLSLHENYRSLAGVLQPINTLFARLFPSREETSSSEPHFEALQPCRSGAAERGGCEFLYRLVPKGEKGGAELECELLARRIYHGLSEKTSPHTFWVFEEGERRRAEPQDIAILLRSRSLLPALEEALQAYQIPYHVSAGVGFYQCQEVKDCLCLLEHILRPDEDYALYGLLRSAFFAAPEELLYGLRLFSGRSLFRRLEHAYQALYERHSKVSSDREAFFEAPLEEGHPLCRRDWIGHIWHLLQRWHQKAKHLPVHLFLRSALEDSGYLATLTLSPNGEEKVANVEKLLSLLRQWHLQEDSLFSLVERLKWTVQERTQEGSPLVEEGQGVQILTIHAAKGKEFPVVFVPALSRSFRLDYPPFLYERHLGAAATLPPSPGRDTSYPLSWRYLHLRQARRQYEEEKRLLYVAMTRARDYLVLTGLWNERKAFPYRSPLYWLAQGLGWGKGPVPTEEIRLVSSEDLSPPEVSRVTSPPSLSLLTASATDERKVVAPPAGLSFSPSLPPLKEVHLSPTALSQFRLCPRRFYYDYLLRLPPQVRPRELFRRTGERRTWGELVHRAIELLLKDLPTEAVLSQVFQEYSLYFQHHPEARSKLVQQLEAFEESQLFQSLLASAEYQSELPLWGKVGRLSWQGTMDLVWKREGEVWILDFKTSSPEEAPEELLEKYRVPMSLYAYSYWKGCGGSLRSALVLVEEPDKLLFYPPWTQEAFREFEEELQQWGEKLSVALSQRPPSVEMFPPQPKKCPFCPTPELCKMACL